MAKGMREIKRSIKSTQNTKQITKAMEMVAAAKLRRAQEAAVASRPYTDKIREVVGSIASGSGSIKHPMLQTRPVKRTAYVVISSDRGLAGGYNTNVLRKLMVTLEEQHKSKDEYDVLVVGRKGRDYVKRRGITPAEEVTGIPDAPKYSDIKAIANAAVKGFEEGRYDEVYLVYNRFVNAISQIPVSKKLLPLSSEEFSGGKVSYEYEPDAESVLECVAAEVRRNRYLQRCAGGQGE